MSKSNTGLTEEKCASLAFSSSGKNKLFDGAGLYLEVTTSGSKRWRMRYKQKNGKETLITFGEYPAVSLEQARQARERVRQAVAQGENPAKVRDAILGTEGATASPVKETAPISSPKVTPPVVTKTTKSERDTKDAVKEDVVIPASLAVSSTKPETKEPSVSSKNVVNKSNEVKSTISNQNTTKATGFSAVPVSDRTTIAASTTDATEKQTPEKQAVVTASASSSPSTSSQNEASKSETGFVATTVEKPIQSSAVPKPAPTPTKPTVTQISSNVTRINPVQKTAAPTTPVTAESEGGGKKIFFRTVLFTLLVAGGVFLFEEYRLSNTNSALEASQKRLEIADATAQQNAVLNSEISKLEKESSAIKKQNTELVSVNDRLKESFAELELAKNEALKFKEEVQVALDKAVALNAVLQNQLQALRAELVKAQELYQTERQARNRAQQSLQAEQQRSEQIDQIRNQYLSTRGQ